MVDHTDLEQRSKTAESGVIWPRVALGAAVLVAAGVVAATVVTRSPGRVDRVIPRGATLVAALEQTISTQQASVGDRIRLRTTAPVRLDDGTQLPPGLLIRGDVTHAKGGGRIAGAPELTLRFSTLEVDGSEYRLDADPFRLRGKNDASESAMEIGGGAVAGAVVGAIAGDALKGAVIGAAAGTGVAVATKGDHLVLPTRQRIRIRLADSVTVSYRPAPPSA